MVKFIVKFYITLTFILILSLVLTYLFTPLKQQNPKDSIESLQKRLDIQNEYIQNNCNKPVTSVYNF